MYSTCFFILRLDVFQVKAELNTQHHTQACGSKFDWCRVKPNFKWNMIIYFIRLQLRLRACYWISMSPDDIKSEWNTQMHSPIRKYKSLQRKHAWSFYTPLNMPFRFMSQPQFRVQTLLSVHKRIQSHSLQFPAKLSIRKMKPWFELFKYSLWSVG